MTDHYRSIQLGPIDIPYMPDRTPLKDPELTGVEDNDLQLVKDPDAPIDAWGQFLAMRFRHRQKFLSRLERSEQELINRELSRIEYFRNLNETRRLKEHDDSTLIESLKSARIAWRRFAVEESRSNLVNCRSKIANGKDAIERQRHVRNARILERVQRWDAEVLPDLSSEPGVVKTSQPPPHYDADPNFGYNGWLIAFENGKDGIVGITNPSFNGDFPHQKMAIKELLYNKAQSPLKRSEDRNTLRYFHLPANNMEWVEAAIARYYGEDNLKFDAPRLLNPRSKAERLLKHELWRGQHRGGPGSPVHSRHVGPRCSVVSSTPFDSDQTDRHESPEIASSLDQSVAANRSKDIALFMPYLHWEVESRLYRMSKTVRDRTKRAVIEDKKHGRRFKGKFAELVTSRSQRIELVGPMRENTVRKEKASARSNGQIRLKLTALGRYLWHVAKLFELIDEAADENLITKHLFSNSPLHPRRTLDQYYSWTAEDTTFQDQRQVVCRGTRSSHDPEATARVVMVDQLWLWILDDNTLLTSFPRRWGRNKPDPSAVHRGIRDHMGKLHHQQKMSIHDLALIVIDECSKVFFDRTKPLDQRPEVVAIFGAAISEIAELKQIAYESFGREIGTWRLEDLLANADELIRKSFNIRVEWSVLEEAQHIIDELQVMQEIFSQQITVMSDLHTALESSGVADTTLERAADLMHDMKMRRAELAGLEDLQAKTREQLRELLDIKQQQAGIVEAKAAISRADEAVMQGRSIVVFTVFSVVFLPLSFFASIFGMNAQEFVGGDAPMNLREQFKYMFSLSSVLTLVSLAFAFSAWLRTGLTVILDTCRSYINHWFDPPRFIYTSDKLKELQKKKQDDLSKRKLYKNTEKVRHIIEDREKKQAAQTGMPRRSSWAVPAFRPRRTQSQIEGV